jgi:hypothetical protein
MMDREKVIKGLECCGYSRFMDKCQECPYDGKDCFKRLKTDAIALLKAQEPRVMAGAELTDAELIEEIRKAPLVLKPNVDAVSVVMTLEEVVSAAGTPAWFEGRSKGAYTGWVLVYDVQEGMGITGTRVGVTKPGHITIWPATELYGAKWRCWTSRPTDEQREAVPWN